MRRLSMKVFLFGLAACVAVGAPSVGRAELVDALTFPAPGGTAVFTYSADLTGAGTLKGGAGAITGGQLTGAILPGGVGSPLALGNLYCVDLTHDINITTGSTYDPTYVNSVGYLHDQDSTQTASTIYAFTNGGGVLKNAGAIDYLMIGNGASTNTAVQAGLQLAIWQLEYGTKLTATSISGAATDSITGGVGAVGGDARTFLTTVGYDPGTGLAGAHNAASDIVPGVLWLSPDSGTGDHWAQAQITVDLNNHDTIPTPVPGTLVLSTILFGTLGLVWSYRRLSLVEAAG